MRSFCHGAVPEHEADVELLLHDLAVRRIVVDQRDGVPVSRERAGEMPADAPRPAVVETVSA
ncbi:MAG: hypothetical protein ABFS41_04920 [Myxococcota bacterium]